MVHLLALPGSPGARPLSEVIGRAVSDAAALLEAGFDGLVVENFGDVPFHKASVSPITITAMTRVVSAVIDVAGGLPVTVNVLRNDALGALAVAAATGARAIRVNVHCGARVTDQGVIEGRAAETLRTRAAWGAEDVAVWADVAVKHSAPLGPSRPIEEEAVELVERGGADAVIVSGSATGSSVDPHTLAAVAAAVGAHPVLIGSGVTQETVCALLAIAHGAIVGTSIKRQGLSTAPVDTARARALVEASRA
jgi:membrane complex biogenesis BtpA family protein